jgi:hypothetical protein
VVGSEAEAAIILARLEAALRDMSPFFRKLERPSGALDVSARETWNKRFGKPLVHDPETVAARARGEGYYANPKGPRATRSSPYFYWTGSLERSASRFTEINADSAKIDPDLNYEGPLDGVLSDPFTTIITEGGIMDEDVFQDDILGRRIERELETYLLNILEGRRG